MSPGALDARQYAERVTGESSSGPSEPSRPLRWVRAAADRVPTKWFAGIATGLFLAATAAFGGLATAPVPGPTALDPGAEYRNDQLSITIDRAVLIDDFPEIGVRAEEGERVLAVLMHLENLWTKPQLTLPRLEVTNSFSIVELEGAEPDSSARYDDSTRWPVLQPHVPADVVFAWRVPADKFHEGDELNITLNALSLYNASFVMTGSGWRDPVAAASVSLTLTDVGAGADTEDAE